MEDVKIGFRPMTSSVVIVVVSKAAARGIYETSHHVRTGCAFFGRWMRDSSSVVKFLAAEVQSRWCHQDS